MRVLLIATLVCASCATTQFPPPQARVQYYEPRVQQIVDRLVAAVPQEDRPRWVSYQIWERPGDVRGRIVTRPLAARGSTIYIHTSMLELSDSALAFGLGHEIGHMFDSTALKRILGISWIPASVGSGWGVAAWTGKWWVGALTGAGIFLFVFPPIILAAARSDELEVDQLGLTLATRAGYDGEAAVGYWCSAFENTEQVLRLRGLDPEDFNPVHPSALKRCMAMYKTLDRIQPHRRGLRIRL